MIVGSYIEIKYKTKGGEIQYSTQEVLQFGYSERYGCQVVVVDKDSPMYFTYPSGDLLLSFTLRALLLHFGQTLKVTFVILAKFGLP